MYEEWALKKGGFFEKRELKNGRQTVLPEQV
jgi:hypothetical protein